MKPFHGAETGAVNERRQTTNSIRGGRNGRGLMAVSVLLFLGEAGISAAPQIVVDQPVYDFGSIANGSQVIHDFVVRNSGDSELDIGRVVSSCESCLRGSLERTRIPPGGEGVLHARLDLRSLDWAVSRDLLLLCNDPKNSPLLLEVRGVVVPYFQVTPAEIDIDTSQGRQAAEAEIVPLVKLRAPLSKVTCDDKGVTARISEEGTNRFVLAVQASDSLPRGNAAINLILQSSDANDPPCHVTGLVRNPPDLELIPDRLRFAPQAEPQMRILWVKQHGAAPLSLIDAVAPSDKFRCEIDPDSSGRDYRVYVTAWGQGAEGRTDALILKMRDQNQADRAVSIPISVDPAEPGGQ